MNNEGKRYFEKIIKLIDTLNENKDENNISRITPNDLEIKLKINRTNLNKIILDINREEQIITRLKGFYQINVTDITEIDRYKKMISIIEEILKNPKELYENEIKIAKKYGIDINELRRIKTIIKMS